MRLPKGRPYSNFTLLELPHLMDYEIFIFDKNEKIKRVRKRALSELEKRLEFGKKVIDEETNPGGLIMIEDPWGFSYHTFLKQYKGTPVLHFWSEIMKRHLNGYLELANYSEDHKTGPRCVTSTTHHCLKPGSGLRTINSKHYYFPESRKKKNSKEGYSEWTKLTLRLRHITLENTNILLRNKIQKQKPRLVIVAAGHAWYLEGSMKPKKVIEYSKIHRPKAYENKENFQLIEKCRLNVFYNNHKKRREEIYETQLRGNLKGGKLIV